MKRLLATTAIATMAMTGAASAQSLLERVLSDISAVPTTNVTGIFANTADNVLAGAVPDTTTIGGTATTTDRVAEEGDLITVTVGANEVTGTLQADGTLVDQSGATIQDVAGPTRMHTHKWLAVLGGCWFTLCKRRTACPNVATS